MSMDLSQIDEKNKIYILAPKVHFLLLKSAPKVTLRANPDLVKEDIPIEIELGHQRLVYADFFEFMADYSNGHIPLAIMIVTGDPKKFGHTWHNSLESTKRKILAIKETFLVPVLVIAVDP